jgi:hypothetical protein
MVLTALPFGSLTACDSGGSSGAALPAVPEPNTHETFGPEGLGSIVAALGAEDGIDAAYVCITIYRQVDPAVVDPSKDTLVWEECKSVNPDGPFTEFNRILPAGNGWYLIAIPKGKDLVTDSSDCKASGPVPFSIVAHEMTLVRVPLYCAGASNNGSVGVDIQFVRGDVSIDNPLDYLRNGTCCVDDEITFHASSASGKPVETWCELVGPAALAPGCFAVLAHEPDGRCRFRANCPGQYDIRLMAQEIGGMGFDYQDILAFRDAAPGCLAETLSCGASTTTSLADDPSVFGAALVGAYTCPDGAGGTVQLAAPAAQRGFVYTAQADGVLRVDLVQDKAYSLFALELGDSAWADPEKCVAYATANEGFLEIPVQAGKAVLVVVGRAGFGETPVVQASCL